MSMIYSNRSPLIAVSEKVPGGVATPHEDPMSTGDLPPQDTKRWTMRRKAAVVAGVRAGLITMEEACERYTLSVEELQSWQHLIDHHGIGALRTTKIQDYRQTSKGN